MTYFRQLGQGGPLTRCHLTGEMKTRNEPVGTKGREGIPDKGTPCIKALKMARQSLVCSRTCKANVTEARLGVQ